MANDRLYKRGKTWWVWGYDEVGKRWSASTHQVDKSAAENVAKRISRDRAIPGASQAASLTLEKALELKIAADERAKNAEATIKYHTSKGIVLARVLGADCQVARLTLADTTAYMDKRLGEGAHRHTIQKEIRMLTESLHVAKRLKLYFGNPSDLKPPELKKAYTPRETWLTAEECERLLSAVGPSRRWHVLAYLQLGIRKSELYRIKPEHVDLRKNQVWIDATKTDDSPRMLPLTVAARAMFETLLRNTVPGEPLFALWADGSSDRDLKAACKRAKVQRCSFNDLRRTFCSLLASAGVPMQHTARLMGHKSLDMVMRVYGRLSPESLQDAVDKLPRVNVAGVVAATLPISPDLALSADADGPKIP